MCFEAGKNAGQTQMGNAVATKSSEQWPQHKTLMTVGKETERAVPLPPSTTSSRHKVVRSRQSGERYPGTQRVGTPMFFTLARRLSQLGCSLIWRGRIWPTARRSIGYDWVNHNQCTEALACLSWDGV